MTKTKGTKRALLMSALSLLMCVSMLIGSTFAWFTDSVTSGTNKIVAGNLDVVLEYKTDWVDDWAIVDEDTKIFKEGALYEPGYTEVVFLRVSNAGSLALKYNLMVNIASEKSSINVDGEKFNLSDYLQIGTYTQDEYSSDFNYADLLMPGMFGTREAALAEVSKNVPGVTPLAKLSEADSVVKSDEPILAGEKTAKVMALVLTMPTTVGNEANYDAKVAAAPEINLGVSLVATQYVEESDSFGSDYDKDAEYPPIAWDGAEQPPVAWDGSVDISWFDAGKTEFTISNGAQLAGMAELGNQLVGKTITLDSDIDLGGKNWTPITIFTPENSFTFDGGNHTIYNLNITSGNADVGLFYDSVGTIKNLKLSDAQIKSGGRSGILAAKHHGDIINCHVKDSTIEDSYWAVGGIVGQLISGNIKNCSVTNVNVKSNGSTGGIVGALNGTNTNGIYTIENCSVIGGTIENVGSYGPDYPGGGIVGMINTNDTVNITGCSSTATLKGEYIFEICPSA